MQHPTRFEKRISWIKSRPQQRSLRNDFDMGCFDFSYGNLPTSSDLVLCNGLFHCIRRRTEDQNWIERGSKHQGPLLFRGSCDFEIITSIGYGAKFGGRASNHQLLFSRPNLKTHERSIRQLAFALPIDGNASLCPRGEKVTWPVNVD